MIDINLPNFITISLIAILAILIFGTLKRRFKPEGSNA